MTQLPPKIPSCHQKLPFEPPSFFPFPTNNGNSNPPWLDEFLDFSVARRGTHRRSISDSVTFLEAPSTDEDGLIMSMFSDDVPPTSPLDHKEGESECNAEAQTQEEEEEEGEEIKPPLDPRRVKRILANRQSAQRSRVRKLHYISELERNVTTLQTEVSSLSPRVAYLDHQRSILIVGNSHLKQRIAALAQDRIFKDAHQEALKKEIERLRQVYHQQNHKQKELLLS